MALFVQAMLSKGKNKPTYTYYTERNAGNKTANVWYQVWQVQLATANKELVIGQRYQYRFSSITSNRSTSNYYIYSWYPGAWNLSNKKGEFTTNSFTNATWLSVYDNDNTSISTTVTRSKIEIYKVEYLIKSLPRELKNIGEKASTTLFGLHIDGTRIDHN